LSHYEYFVGFHRELYRHVEPVTVNPFSPRARDRAVGLCSWQFSVRPSSCPARQDRSRSRGPGGYSNVTAGGRAVAQTTWRARPPALRSPHCPHCSSLVLVLNRVGAARNLELLPARRARRSPDGHSLRLWPVR